MARTKDIQFASRADSHILRQKQNHPPAPRDPRAGEAAARRAPGEEKIRSSRPGAAARRCTWRTCWRRASTTRTTPRTSTSRPTGIRLRRAAGYADTMRMIARAPWRAPADPIEGVIEHRSE
jgi:NTE family protein